MTAQLSEAARDVPKLKILLVIDPVTVYATDSGDYVTFTSNLDVCNDGSGPPHGDPYHQAQTAYWNNGKFLNADKDKYVVIPPQIRSMVAPVVMGCQARVQNLHTKKVFPGVVGDIGPDDKTGEAAYCLAIELNPAVGHNVGDSRLIYKYELFPGKPAVVNGKTYKLEPATA
jgi:hypothetical protein